MFLLEKLITILSTNNYKTTHIQLYKLDIGLKLCNCFIKANNDLLKKITISWASVLQTTGRS